MTLKMDLCYFSLAVTYNNQNLFVGLIGCDDNTTELKLSELRYFKNHLNCKTIDDMEHQIETGYHIHTKTITKEESELINEYNEKYFDDEIGCAILDTNFEEHLPSEYDTCVTKRIMAIVLEDWFLQEYKI